MRCILYIIYVVYTDYLTGKKGKNLAFLSVAANKKPKVKKS